MWWSRPKKKLPAFFLCLLGALSLWGFLWILKIDWIPSFPESSILKQSEMIQIPTIATVKKRKPYFTLD
jgi:hypothetical protein